MLVVYGLYAPAGRNVIFACRELHRAVVWQVHGYLYESLAVCARAEHHGTVQVLKAAACYLAGTCRVVIYKYDDRHDGVYRLNGSLVSAVVAAQLATSGDKRDTFRHKHVYNAYSLVEQSAAVVAQVNDQSFGTFPLKAL